MVEFNFKNDSYYSLVAKKKIPAFLRGYSTLNSKIFFMLLLLQERKERLKQYCD